MSGMPTESQLSARDAGSLLRALERLEKLLLSAETERMSPHHHQLMEQARCLNTTIGIRVARLGGGIAAVRHEWRHPSRPDEEIRVDLEAQTG